MQLVCKTARDDFSGSSIDSLADWALSLELTNDGAATQSEALRQLTLKCVIPP